VAARRPSYKSIRARQRNILEGIGTADVKYKEAAKRLGVTPRELKTFVETKPRKLRPNFNRSPAYRKLYGASTAPEQRKQVREQLGIPRVRRYQAAEQDIQALRLQRLPEKELRNRTQIGEQIQNLYYRGQNDRYLWAAYAREHDLPTSIDTLRLLHRNDKVSDSEYAQAVKTWRDIYNVSQERASLYEDEIAGIYDQEYEEAAG
jgi:hypothetical protein